ncbi:hypothetical protein MBANPS3_010241 [Mucor bainieri]
MNKDVVSTTWADNLAGKTELELGCGECALVGGVNTTKEVVDTGFKLPKVMKDMAMITEFL